MTQKKQIEYDKNELAGRRTTNRTEQNLNRTAG